MGVTSLSRDGIVANQKYSSALAGNDTADVALSSDFLIQEVVLNGTAASVTFDVSTLASTYKHLQIRMIVLNGSVNTNVTGYQQVTCNGSSSTIYSSHVLYGNGSSAGSNAGYGASATKMYGGTFGSKGSTPLAPSAFIYDFLDFASTSKNKTMRYLSGFYEGGAKGIELGSGSFQSTTAITSITFTPESAALYGSGTRFNVYGSKG
jgi:hypothetical protein